MSTPRSAAEEARDPRTPPDRLLELARKHPQLQGLIVTNPSAPRVAREWILATNPWARRLHEEQGTGPGETSVWGDLFTEPRDSAPPPSQPAPPASPGTAPAPIASSHAVHVAPDRGVVPLGAAGAGSASGPAAPENTNGPAAHPGIGVGGGAHPVSATGTGGPVASTGPAGSAQGQGSDRRPLWLIGGCCLILALLLLVAAALGVRALLTADEDAYQRPSSEPAAAQSPAEGPAATAEEPAEDPVSPAPEDALELEEIASPTGNITCSLQGDSVGCSVAERDFSEAGLEDCAEGPFSIRAADGEAAPACGQGFGAAGATTLEYGASALHGDVACTSEFDGMTCWNTRTGAGFFVNRVTYETL